MSIIINQEKVTQETASALLHLCPFGAMEYIGGKLSINAGCKNCKLCVKNGPTGVVSWQETEINPALDKSQWKGIAVFAQCEGKNLHPVTPELIGKARQLASVIQEKVMAVIIGHELGSQIDELLSYGVDEVHVYDHSAFSDFTITPYANAFYDFICRKQPGSILVGATNMGRSLAPKVAARCCTGLTADCTILEMKENTDLVQIRPAFGGNIMAQIVTPNARPQFCTVRYKIFSAPEKVLKPFGTVHFAEVTDGMVSSKTEVISVTEKTRQSDISDAEILVACGRGFTKEADLEMATELARLLGAELACTRPLVEAGWMDARKQIGLSGRTVKPKLIIAIGISGSVQFVAGMNGADQIVAINADPNAAIFDIAHVGLVGNLYEIIPSLIEKIREEKCHV